MSDQQLIEAYNRELEPDSSQAWAGGLGMVALLGGALWWGGPRGFLAGWLVAWALFKAMGRHFEEKAARSALAAALFERGILHLGALPFYRRRLPELAREAGAPLTLIFMRGWGLPLGRAMQLLIRLDRAAGTGELTLDDRPVPLAPEEVAAISAHVERFLADPRTASRFPVCDGYPCDLVVAASQPPAAHAVECNLCDPDKTAPVLGLARALHELASARSRSGSIAR